MEYTINPVLMGGTVKSVSPGEVRLHIRGRLGVITIRPDYISGEEPPQIGSELSFYFSYLRVTDEVFAVDLCGLKQREPFPTMVYGSITEINDTAIKAAILGEIGTVAVPLRFVFTDVPLALGQSVEFYLSHMTIIR